VIETLFGLATQAGHDMRGDDAYAGSSIENPSTPLTKIFDTGDLQTWTGKTIGEKSALNISTVVACARIISQGVGRLPFFIYETDGKSKNWATNHSLWTVLGAAPDPHWTAFRFKRQMTWWAALLGNAYALMDVSPNGRVMGLRPIHPRFVRPIPQYDGGLAYEVQNFSGHWFLIPSEMMLHLRGLESNGDGIGLSVVSLARQSMGLSLATEEFGARLFGNGAINSGVYQTPKSLSDKALAHLRESFSRQYVGLANAHKPMILEEGMTWQSTSISPDDAQFLATRKFQVADICRWFGIPPHMVGDLERSTNNNIEHQSLEFIRDCLGPWLANWESEAENQLLSKSERMRYCLEFSTDVLTRGDAKAESEADSSRIQNGVMTPNEVRAKRGLSPAPGGDQLLVNGTLRPLAGPMAGAAETEEPGESEDGTVAEDPTTETPVGAIQ
jgi:HK97 family phage portal protein